MEHSISQLARMAGISSRTLRHYHAIGLLVPSRVSDNGYRWYGRRELLRLQRILLLRELDVPLSQMRDILEGQTDELGALRRHRAELVAERDRLQQVIDTIDRTTATLCGTSSVGDEDFFTGLAAGRSRLQQVIVDRYGAAARDHFIAAEAATAGWDRRDYEQAAAEGRRLLEEMAQARARGVEPGAPEAMHLVAQHHAQVLAVWPADAAAYHALGDLLLADADQRAMIVAVDPGLPAWLSAAVQAYAVHHLGHRST